MDPAGVELRLDPRRIIAILTLASVLLLVLGLVAAMLRVTFGVTLQDLVWRFELHSDSSIATWFASATLAFAALLLLWLAAEDRHPAGGWRAGWLGLAGVTLLLSIDEVATLHEWTGGLVTRDLHGFLNYTWVLFGIPAVTAFFLVFGRFVLSQPQPHRRLLIGAAAIYFGGALGMEMLNARIEDSAGVESTSYVIGSVIEEALEMTGVLVLLYALLGRLAGLDAAVRLRLAHVPKANEVHAE